MKSACKRILIFGALGLGMLLGMSLVNQFTQRIGTKLLAEVTTEVTVNGFQQTSPQKDISRYQVRANVDWSPETDPTLNVLTQNLMSKLDAASPKAFVKVNNTICRDLNVSYLEKCNVTSCLRRKLPENIASRIEELVFRDNLKILKRYQDALRQMASEISEFCDVILVTGFSSNHYQEGQLLIKHVHEKVVPVLRNLTFVIYNLGLSDHEAAHVRKYCRCKFVNFPFHLFPEFFRRLHCFSFKPAIIRAMYERANFVIWSDTSIRTLKGGLLQTLIHNARTRGIQQRYFTDRIRLPWHTLPETFEYFGDLPCAYMSFGFVEGGFGVYHRDLLIQRAVLDPLFGCALRQECICPNPAPSAAACPAKFNKSGIGFCHRHDQSVITMILAKLFSDKFRSFAVDLWPDQIVVREYNDNITDILE